MSVHLVDQGRNWEGEGNNINTKLKKCKSGGAVLIKFSSKLKKKRKTNFKFPLETCEASPRSRGIKLEPSSKNSSCAKE